MERREMILGGRSETMVKVVPKRNVSTIPGYRINMWVSEHCVTLSEKKASAIGIYQRGCTACGTRDIPDQTMHETCAKIWEAGSVDVITKYFLNKTPRPIGEASTSSSSQPQRGHRDPFN